MSEITKLYENAGIEPTKNWQSCLNCKLKTEIRYDEWGEEYITCKMLERPEKCPNAKKYYPPFTAEKQIELIKNVSPSYPLNYHTKCFQGYSFKEGLAKCINNLWQHLTEEKKQQVKGILE